jgi:hypothetical protein
MLPTAGSSDTVSEVTAPRYLLKSPEYPPTSWKAVRARSSRDPAPVLRSLGPTYQRRAMSLPLGRGAVAGDLRAPTPLAEPLTITREDKGPRKNNEGLHHVRVHQRC